MARGGDCSGPPGRGQFTGHPERIGSSPQSDDEDAQRRRWALPERPTGVTLTRPTAANHTMTGRWSA